MRTLRRNQQTMKYALSDEVVPIYVLDENGNKIVDFIDEDGNIYYRETGSYRIKWKLPVDFFGNIAMSGGEAEAQEFGLSVGDYSAVIVVDKGSVPIVEGSLIWLKSDVKYLDNENTDVDETSADFRVIKASESLNEMKYILKAIVK